MFLGYARGSVGDVVFSRLDGKQIARARNRSPRNPKTSPQLYQRAIMATVMQAYSAGKAIFDHSFQGKAVGSECQRYFLSRNSRLLREYLANDIARGSEVGKQISAAFNAPKTVTPVPNQLLISEGTYDMSFFTIFDPISTQPQAQIALSSGYEENVTTFRQWLSTSGLVSGDIFTFLAILYDLGDNNVFVVPGANEGGVQRDGRFAFVRLRVKSFTDEQLDSLMSTSEGGDNYTFGDVFEAVSNISLDVVFLSEDITSQPPVYSITAFLDSLPGDLAVGSFGIIRSRLNEDLRSTSYMHWATWNHRTGLDWEYVLQGWQLGAEPVGDSELILEGGDDNVTPVYPE